MIKAQCDRCGKQAETSGSVVGLTIGIMQTRQTKLPQGWHRVPEPVDDERIEWPRRELCPECVEALRDFFRGDGAVAGLLSPETIASADECPECGDTGACNGGPCPLSHAVEVEQAGGPSRVAAEAPHAETPDEAPLLCPRCGTDISDYDDDDFVYRTGDERPYCSGECVVAAHRAALKIAAGELCVCAGVGFGTEDCPAHHPNGVAEGTHLPCQLNENGDCPGIFRRGMFPEHMERWHKVKVSERSKPCPYCPAFFDGIMLTGQHIAKEHPGDWQAWIDGGQNAG